MFIQYLFSDAQYFFWWVIIAAGSVCLHELFHALAAYWEGDSTAKDAGYFTLNPLKHMGGASLVVLMLTGMCWGLCPVNPSRFRHTYGDALVAFAGPFANLLIMALSGLAALLLMSAMGESASALQMNLLRFFRLAAMANAAFFLFNLIPIPPLDGHSIISSFLPGTRSFFQSMGNAGFMVVFILFSIPAARAFFWGGATLLSQGSMLLWSGLLGL
ncbi:site-2 protease family protein [Vampirovibrio sp.]|uniref:site-2 protease family protein n=1 Tax=Vampirovibrio sp. TaxID=2717857 RepID=UPI0035948A56